MSLLLCAAARGESVPRTPVWFMRQAGRSLPEYRKLRESTTMLQACRTPELVTEITLQPVRRHGVDAAIFFSDIVVPIQAAGVDVDIVAGVGPVIAHPMRTAADVANLRELSPADIPDIAVSISTLRDELRAKHPGVALIGFAGAPFTLASYLIEGGPSKNHEHTKAMMLGQPELFAQLLGKLAHNSATFLRVQVEAGADAFQLFDSWAGILNAHDYREQILPHSAAVFQALDDLDVPRFHFGVQTGELLSTMATAGSDVLGVDFRVDLAAASPRIGPDLAMQGNLDPAHLFAPWPVLRQRVEDIVRKGVQHPGGFVFNLGHGVLPGTDPEVPGRVVAAVHEISAELVQHSS